MRMLGEMAVAYPAVGGFYEYNRLALGELAGFLTGWMYWYFWVIVVALEAVAGARIFVTGGRSARRGSSRLALMTALHARESALGALLRRGRVLVRLDQGGRDRRVSRRRRACSCSALWPGAHAGAAAPHGPRRLHAERHRAGAHGRGRGHRASTSAPRSSRSPRRSRPSPSKAVAETTQSVIWRVLVFYVGSIFLVVAWCRGTTARAWRALRERHGGAADSRRRHRHEPRDPHGGAVGAQLRPVRLLAHADGARRARRCAARLAGSTRAACRSRRFCAGTAFGYVDGGR